MPAKYIFLFGLLMTQALSQYLPEPNISCKPLSQMARHYDQLAKASDKANYVDYGNYDVKYYDLTFDIDADNQSIIGYTEITFQAGEDSLDRLILDFTSDLNVESVYGDARSFEHTGIYLRIYLDTPLQLGERATIGINYSGQPMSGGLMDFDFYFGTQDDTPMISTLSEPYGAQNWWPCKNTPTDKADSLRVTITADENLIAVSNGFLVQEYASPLRHTKTWIWEHNYPITTYLVFLSITDYAHWEETYTFEDGQTMPLQYWVYDKNYGDAIVDLWNRTPIMLDVFSDLYGKYPFADEKYGMAEFNWGGAMEHQTCSSMGEGSTENTIVHELAHQWWGDMVTCTDFHHIWINEGFATYSEALFKEQVYGEEAFHAHMAAKDYDYIGSVFRYDTTNTWEIFDYIVYGKGAWTLHMLRHIVGDENFFNILANFREQYLYSYANTEDFQKVAELVWGQDLEWFFDQWIYGINKPHYEWWWSILSTDAEGNTSVLVTIDQIDQSGTPVFKMPIDLKFSNELEDTILVVWDSLSSQQFTLDLDFEPLSLEFDPDVWIHKKESQLLSVEDNDQRPVAFALRSAYPNPFNQELTIDYTVNASFDGKLTIISIDGKVVAEIPVIHAQAGEYTCRWNGLNTERIPLSSGIYMVRLSDRNSYYNAQKVTLLR